MMIDALNRAGIVLRNYKAGAHRTACPKCNKSPKDDALKVDISDEGSVWYCHRCHWTGNAVSGTTREGELQRRHHRDEPKPATLQPEPLKLWHECRPIVSDRIAGKYLAGRSCGLVQNDLRWHPAIWHPAERKEIPAMVALVTDIVSAEPISLHFTFLARDGSGKAPIERPRLYLAGHRKQGGVVRLFEDAEVDQGLIVGEGVETCLSWALEFRPIWACLDAGNVAAFPVLPGIEALTVLIDHDAAGQAAFEKVAARWRAAGREVIGIRSPIAGEDINDAVQS
jgi:hypothetical protein